jgi:hypothetical protein
METTDRKPIGVIGCHLPDATTAVAELIALSRSPEVSVIIVGSPDVIDLNRDMILDVKSYHSEFIGKLPELTQPYVPTVLKPTQHVPFYKGLEKKRKYKH